MSFPSPGTGIVPGGPTGQAGPDVCLSGSLGLQRAKPGLLDTFTCRNFRFSL